MCLRFRHIRRHIWPSDSVLNVSLVENNTLYCAESIVAGVGFSSDHCHDLTNHGRHEYRELEHICNFGLSEQFNGFRDFLLSRFRIKPVARLITAKVTIGMNLPTSRARVLKDGLIKLVAHVNAMFNDSSMYCMPIQVDRFNMAALSMRKQLEVVSSTAIFVVAAGGGSYISLCLPDWGTRIIFYDLADIPHDTHLYSQVHPSTTVYVQVNASVMHKDVSKAIHNSLLKFCYWHNDASVM